MHVSCSFERSSSRRRACCSIGSYRVLLPASDLPLQSSRVLGSQLVLYVELRVGPSFPSPANKEFKIHGALVRNATFGDVV